MIPRVISNFNLTGLTGKFHYKSYKDVLKIKYNYKLINFLNFYNGMIKVFILWLKNNLKRYVKRK